jgi:hypothetical protein
MLRALVAEIRRRGAAALVVVSPVPLEWLQTMVPVDPEEWAARLAVVREAVEDAGGEMLDLHDLLPPAEFSDTAGHMTPVGHRHIAEAVALPLGALLGLPAAQRTGTAAPGRP